MHKSKQSKVKLNISAVGKYFHPVAAGIEFNMLETYSVLAQKHGHQVEIHTTTDTHTEPDKLAKREKYRGLKIQRSKICFSDFWWPRINWRKTDVVALHNFNIWPHLGIMFYTLILKFIFRVASIFHSSKNIGQASHNNPPPILILTPHGGFNPIWEVFPWPRRIVKKLYHQTIGLWMINHAVDGVRAVSEWEKQEMIKSGIKPSLIRVISNGIEDEAFIDLPQKASAEIKSKVKQWGKYIIQIGRIYPIKNIETAIKALPSIPSDINYVVIGGVEKNQYPEYFNQLKSLAKKLGVEKRVYFPGVIKKADKFYAIKHAQMMVHMALWESFCIVVYEGMSQGIPCVVADNTALPLLIKNNFNGYTIKTRDYQALAKKVNYILKNKNSAELKKMSEYNVQFARKRAWSNVANEMGEWYVSLFHNSVDKQVSHSN